MDTKSRRRKYTREKQTTGVVLQERDRELFELLDPQYAFKFLTTSWIAYLFGIYDDEYAYDGLQRRLAKLFHAGYLDRPERQRYSPNTNYKDFVYERTDKAARLLGSAPGAGHRSNSYPHEILADLGYQAPLHAAAKAKGWTLIHAKTLMSGASFTVRTKDGVRSLGFPDSTRQSRTPFWGDMDMPPHLIDRGDDLIFIPGIQVDRSTESLRNINPKDPKRTTLTKHLDEIISFHQCKLFQSYYGFSSAIYPVITIDEPHELNARNYIQDRIGKCGYIVFKTIPDIAYLDHFPAPSAEIITTPWRRAGMADFIF